MTLVSIRQKDDIGVGGSWSEFINYLMDSIKSANVKLAVGGFQVSTNSGVGHGECSMSIKSLTTFLFNLMDSIKSANVKLVVGGFQVSTNSGVGHGAKFAKLIAHKTKGTPVITISLDRLMNSSANDAVAIISWQIFKASRSRHDLLVKGMRLSNGSGYFRREQQRSYELTNKLSAEKENNEIIKAELTRALSSKEQKLLEFAVSEKDQLSLALSSKKQKLSEFTVPDRLSPIASPLINLDTTTVCDATSSLDQPSSQGSLSMKFSSRAVPAYRRQHVSGILLDDSEDDGW
ncbi:hypothetical protein IFM89_031780 [Coptis chinensis]|uniref:Uncharacterized protein n=1 Tax=Coptis chinensis TaxID=261450 RepID=A0A835J1L5_9MAGN|nr:hypothetical protein IFM89_031780 [Coptis chinensis]